MMYRRLFFILIIEWFGFAAFSQTTNITGIITDKQSDEPIPFASVYFKKDGRGTLTDSSGNFSLYKTGVASTDSLLISSVGYKTIGFLLSQLKDSSTVSIQLEVLPPSTEAVVRSKYNRALWFWHKVMANKKKNDIQRWNNYSYEVYNKLELDLDNVNKNKLSNTPVLKKLDFVLQYIDSTSADKPYLPVYLTETLSNFYKQRQPYRTREVIKATITNGLDNQSIIKSLGNTYQNIDVYDNTIPVFDKYFTSPFSESGDTYYNFTLRDTQYLNKKLLGSFFIYTKTCGCYFFYR